jgi:hypothetical protein
LLFKLPLTVAVNNWEPYVSTDVGLGETATRTREWRITLAVPDFVVSTCETAVMLMAFGRGPLTEVGAV